MFQYHDLTGEILDADTVAIVHAGNKAQFSLPDVFTLAYHHMDIRANTPVHQIVEGTLQI